MRCLKYTLIALSIFLTNCASEEEKEARRRQNAFDLSGTYRTITEDSEVQLEFTITNQNGKHYIFIKVDRTSPLSDEEKKFIQNEEKKYSLPEGSLTNIAFPTNFGAEGNSLDEPIGGGKNISKDFGRTSEFHVCSDNPQSKNEINPISMTLSFYYCLSGTVRKENKNIIENGVLSLLETYSFEKGNFESSIIVTNDVKAVLNYKAEKVTPNQ